MSLRGMGTEMLFIDPEETSISGRTPRMYREPGQHIEILGATGSGKTATLLKVIYNLWKCGETVIWRDDANLEFLSFLNIAPIRLWQPYGCDLMLEHPSIEKRWYNWQNPEELFTQLDNERINVILFDLFTIQHRLTVKFWTDFFYEIYRYKRSRIQEPWTLAIDELNDLAPGSRRGFIKGQLTLSSNIYSSTKKFRKMRIRLVGSTHNWNDIHAPIRGQFQYYFFKNTRREHVPERFMFYAMKIENMKVNECIIVDRRGKHQFVKKWNMYSRSHRDPEKWIKLEPVQRMVPWEGEIEEPEEDKSGLGELWKTRTVLLLRVLKDLYAEQGGEFGYREIAALLDLSISPAHTYDTLAEQIPEDSWREQLELADLTVAEYNAMRQSKSLKLEFG